MICFHHADLDGRCAAAIVNKWWRQREAEGQRAVFVELDYKDPVLVESICPGEQVVIVDFSFKPDVMAEVFKITNHVIWCDHHKTAAAYDYGRHVAGMRDFNDKGMAGCELTWQWLYVGQSVPWAVTLIGDRDAWRWEHGKRTAEFNQGCKLFDLSPDSPNWESLLIPTADIPDPVTDICKDGATCLCFRDSFCADYAKSYGFETEFDGIKAFAMGLYMFGSEGFGERFKQYPMCLSFVFDGSKWTVGLYSETIDVGEIATRVGKQLGALSCGGHKGAAGMVVRELPFRRLT